MTDPTPSLSGPPSRPGGRRRRSASVGFIVVTLAIDALGFGLVVPIMPLLIQQLAGSTPSEASLWVGLTLTGFAVMQFACAPIIGGLSDRFGRRPVLLLSLAGIGTNYLLLAWAPSLAWLMLGRCIAGATAANASTATAYIADVTPPHKRAASFGLVGASFGLGFVIGPAVGGLLGAYGLRVPFLAAAVLAGCNLLYGAFVLPESLPPSLRRRFDWKRANPVGSLRALTHNPNLGRLAIAWGCSWFALGALQTSFVLANEIRFGWDTRHNGLALAVAGLGSALVQGLLVRRIIAALSERRAAMTGTVMTATAYVLIALAPVSWVVILGILLQAAGAFTGPAVQGMVSASVGPERQGETQGALTSVQGLTAIISPVVAGLVFAHFAGPDAMVRLPGAPFLVSALAFLVALVAVTGVRVPAALAEEETAAVGVEADR
ncbi:TCR/Tet family MFS transporter [Rhodopila sp.]|jgi:DHA1 family tetracycline resistance protein-like MFS transporter|uniref:TCR/Tet family MFS transporter n=1 Tax=Rhodopila sp. TaxID=2480087 RepID=UPI002BAF70BF|nr:TCR/Tet family MFS transporter [Rhodopila sp.]HVZ08215.1 TCR/Tet family MFS transporter [Rhodopila sp.]